MIHCVTLCHLCFLLESILYISKFEKSYFVCCKLLKAGFIPLRILDINYRLP